MLVIGGAALVSCTKNQDDLLPTTETATTTNALQKVKVENGYLVFEDLAHYDAVATQVIAMTETQRQLWEKQLSFKSYYTLYNEATAAYSDAATEEETQAVLTQNQDIMTLDADQTPERTLRYGSLGLLFNRSGIVKIGNYLKQCTPNDKQVLVFDGDLNTLAAARAAGRTNVAANVYVFDVQRASTAIDERSPNLLQCENWMGGSADCLKRKKLRGNIDCFLDASAQQAGGSSLVFKTLAELHANAWYQKNLSGSNKWADYDTNMRVNGSFSTTGTSAAPVIPSTSFDYTTPNYENHIDLYWQTAWISGMWSNYPTVWLYTVNANYRMTNLAAFTCSGITSGANIPLTCNITQ
jgi:hypothetical protein